MGKIAVLGSSGQIGSHLVTYLNNKGYNAIGYDWVPSETTIHKRDLSNISHFNKDSIHDYDFIFFLAFDAGGSRYLGKYQHTYKFTSNNVKLMSNVFDAISGANVPTIFTSSQMSNMTFSPYGLQKQLGELYTRILNHITVKFWNVYGVEHDEEKSHVITDFINKAKTDKRIDMLTDGTEQRQFLYADDCCEGLEAIMLNYDSIDRDKPLHITNFEWTTILDVANTVASYFPDCTIHSCDAKDMVQQNKRNEPDPYIKKYWEPKTNLHNGIGKIINAMENSCTPSE